MITVTILIHKKSLPQKIFNSAAYSEYPDHVNNPPVRVVWILGILTLCCKHIISSYTAKSSTKNDDTLSHDYLQNIAEKSLNSRKYLRLFMLNGL